MTKMNHASKSTGWATAMYTLHAAQIYASPRAFPTSATSRPGLGLDIKLTRPDEDLEPDVADLYGSTVELRVLVHQTDDETHDHVDQHDKSGDSVRYRKVRLGHQYAQPQSTHYPNSYEKTEVGHLDAQRESV